MPDVGMVPLVDYGVCGLKQSTSILKKLAQTLGNLSTFLRVLQGGNRD